MATGRVVGMAITSAAVLILALVLNTSSGRLWGWNLASFVDSQLPASVREQPQVGLSLLSNGTNSTADVVFIHGLNGHRERTWTAENGVFWPRDLLPHDIPQLRIYSWGYDARIISKTHISTQFLHDHARDLVSHLSLARTQTNACTTRRPIIFIAHSLGGIIAKRALILGDSARAGHLEHYKAIKLSTRSVYFFGTPHQGGNGVSIGNLLLNIGAAMLKTNAKMLQHLSCDSEYLQLLTDEFIPLSADFEMKYFYETRHTELPGGSSMIIVKKTSAVLPGTMNAESIGIYADHRNMVRYLSRDDSSYQMVAGHLAQSVLNAEDVIAQAWEIYDDMRAILTHQARFNITFNFPHRRNAYFVGRQDALQHLRDGLMNRQYANGNQSKQRIDVVSGIGGIGKSQLIIEFIYRHRAHYTSILWIESGSAELIHHSFELIAHSLLHDFKRNRHRSIRGLSETFAAFESAPNNDKAHRAIELVLRWLSEPANDCWLLVFDSYDDIEQIDIQDFLPTVDAGNVIVTTRRPEAGRLGHHLELDLFAEEDAVDLLLKSARQTLSDGSVANEAKIAARKIAHELGYLPLALDQAGAYIYAQRIAVSEYLPKFRSNFQRVSSRKPKANWPYDKTLFNAWELSLEAIQSKNPTAILVLTISAFLGPQIVNVNVFKPITNYEPSFYEDGNGFRKLQEITESVFSTEPTDINDVISRFDKLWIDTSENLDETIELLFSYSLAKRRGADGIDIHPLVKLWATERLNKTDQIEVVRHAVILIAEAHHLDDRMAELSFSKYFYPQLVQCRDLIQRHLIDDLSTSADHALLLSVERLVVDFLSSRQLELAVELLQPLINNPRTKSRAYGIVRVLRHYFADQAVIEMPRGSKYADFWNGDALSVYQLAEVEFMSDVAEGVSSDLHKSIEKLFKAAASIENVDLLPIVERQELLRNLTQLQKTLTTPFRHRNPTEEERGELQRIDKGFLDFLLQVEIASNRIDGWNTGRLPLPLRSLADLSGHIFHPISLAIFSATPPDSKINGISVFAAHFTTDLILSKLEETLEICWKAVKSLSTNFPDISKMMLESLLHGNELLGVLRLAYLPSEHPGHLKAYQRRIEMYRDVYSAKEMMSKLETTYLIHAMISHDPSPNLYRIKWLHLVKLLVLKVTVHGDKEDDPICISLELLVNIGQMVVDTARINAVHHILPTTELMQLLGDVTKFPVCENDTEGTGLLGLPYRPDGRDVFDAIVNRQIANVDRGVRNSVPESLRLSNSSYTDWDRPLLLRISLVFSFFKWYTSFGGAFGRILRAFVPQFLGSAGGLIIVAIIWRILSYMFPFLHNHRTALLVVISSTFMQILGEEIIKEFLSDNQIHVLAMLGIVGWFWSRSQRRA